MEWERKMLNDKWFEMNQSTHNLIGDTPKRKFVQIRWGSILAVVLLVVLVIQNSVFFHLNRPQDIVKELRALVATLPNSIPDHNRTDLARHWAALQTALAELKAELKAELEADLEAGQTSLAELKAGQMALGELKAGQEAGQEALAELKAELKEGQTALAELKAELKAGQTSLAELKAGQEAGQTALAELKAGQMALAELKAELKAGQTALAELKAGQEAGQEALAELKEGLMPRDCSDIKAAGKSTGVYLLFSGSNSFKAYCDMWQDGGGWTVIQRRRDGTVNFFRGWNDYREGFGDPAGEHWLGLRNIYALTFSGAYQLRIDFTAFDGREYYARYDDFSVGRNSRDPEKDGYPLLVSGYSGDAGDRLFTHSGMKFTTKDRDQDPWNHGNCANDWKGGWWYERCLLSNLNGLYKTTGSCDGTNAVWIDLGGPRFTCLRFVEMKIRPRK